MKHNNYMKLYGKYISVCIQSMMQYKLSFLLMVAGRFLVAFNEFIAIKFLFSGFREIRGYTYGDVLLCFSVVQMSFALAELLGNGFKAFAGLVRRGDFDRMLLRPCSLILQIMGTKFDIGRLGPLLTACITLVLGIRSSRMQATLGNFLVLSLMILGGTLLFGGLFMLGATFCFFSIQDTTLINVLTYGAKTHGKYPIDVYGKGILRFCTFLVPYALIQYYPLQYILNRSDQWQLALCPLGIVFFLLVCYLLWYFGVRNYKSCGS